MYEELRYGSLGFREIEVNVNSLLVVIVLREMLSFLRCLNSNFSMKICVINVLEIEIFDFFIKLFLLLKSLKSRGTR